MHEQGEVNLGQQCGWPYVLQRSQQKAAFKLRPIDLLTSTAPSFEANQIESSLLDLVQADQLRLHGPGHNLGALE
jgi:hypothetical protein